MLSLLLLSCLDTAICCDTVTVEKYEFLYNPIEVKQDTATRSCTFPLYTVNDCTVAGKYLGRVFKELAGGLRESPFGFMYYGGEEIDRNRDWKPNSSKYYLFLVEIRHQKAPELDLISIGVLNLWSILRFYTPDDILGIVRIKDSATFDFAIINKTDNNSLV